MNFPFVRVLPSLCAAVAVVFIRTDASAQAVTVPNYSFEAPALGNGADSLTANTTGNNWVWALNGGQTEGIENPSGKFTGDNTGTGAITGADGVNAAFINAGGTNGSGTITTAATLGNVSAGNTYTLTVAVGNPSGGGTQVPGSFTIALLVNGAVATSFPLTNANKAIPDGTFKDFTTSFTASAAQAGGALTAQLYHVNQGTGNGNAQLFFDNVRVTGTIAVPGTDASFATVSSPDGNLVCKMANVSGRLTFSVNYKGAAVVQPSPLGITVGGQDLGAITAVGTPVTSAIAETYPLKGGHSTATNNCNVAAIPITSSTNWTLEVRVFNDGVAYRYNVPVSGSQTVAGDASQWILPSGGTIYDQDAGNTSYESTFATSAVSSLATNAQIRTTAVTQLPGPLYVMMTEANLIGYSDMSLQYLGSNTFKSIFLQDTSPWTAQGPVVSPWRVTVVAPDLNTLANTDILPNLCPAPSSTLANAAWIKPGRSTWEWLVDGHPVYANQQGWVDRTAQLGFDYYLIDDGWNTWTSGSLDAWGCMKAVCDYAKTKNVAVWAWVNTSEVTTAAQRAAYFQNAKNAGLVGLKIDFMGAPNTTWVQWYDDTLSDAAAYQLMIDFHGCVKPTGRERTWPHEMTREGINGLENGARPGLHDSVLPFTRFVQGHADYTPTDFRSGGQLGSNSYAHELAQAIVYTSPFFCYGGDPANYLQSSALDILEQIPATWDETRVLSGSTLGQVAGYARRKGQVWFIGVVNGATAGTFSVPLDFLTAGTPYVADELADSSTNNAAWVRTRASVTSTSAAIPASLRAGGGFVARIVPAALLPAAVTGVAATGGAGNVQIGWNAVAGATSYLLQRAAVSGGPYTTVASGLPGTAFTDTSMPAGTTLYYTVSAVNGYGSGSASAEASASATGTGLSAAWNDADIGSPGAAGYATFYNGVYTLNGAGADVWNSDDAFHFTSQSWSGDGVLTARIAALGSTAPWAKVGVMFRETSASNSKYAFAMMTPGNGTAFQLRTTTNVNTNTTGVSAPYWVRLVRSGDTFSAYASPDGITWTQTGAATSNPMAANLFAGLAVCSDVSGTLIAASFDHVTLAATPANMSVTPLSESQLRLNWTSASTGETGYAVSRSPAGANTWTVLANTLPPGTTTYADNGLAASTSYDYQVAPTSPGIAAPAAAITAMTPAGVGDGIPGWWRYQYFGNGLSAAGNAAANADPDGDGITNLLEYATGSDPTKADGHPPLRLGTSPDGTRATLTFNRIADPALIYTVVATDDLTASPWPEVVWSSTGAANAAGPVTITDTALIRDKPRRFLRLQISR